MAFKKPPTSKLRSASYSYSLRHLESIYEHTESVYSMERRRKNRTVADVNAINTVAAKAEDSTENEEEFVKYGAVDEFYDLGKEIGRGSYGTVKTCIQKSTRDVYAVKMVKTSNHTVRKNVLREIEIMRALGSHSRLVALRDAYQTPFEISMVLEFVPGGELFERIVAEEFLMEDDAIDYVGQILEALQFMHRKNIVHLDLKPENILCVSMDSHDVKLVDFGLARDLDSEEEVKSSFGTPDFVAPEVIRMKPVSCASDLWSLGVVTYVLLSGLMPFSGDDDHQTLIKVAKADWDFDDDCFDDLSQDAKDFIEGLLVKEPSERLTIEECFSHPWIKDAKDTVVKIHTQKHKAFMAKRRWKKSVNALLAVRRMSLSPLFSRNRRSSMDPSILKSSSEADEEQQNGDRKALSPLGTLDLNDQAHHPMSRSCFDLNAKTIRALQKKADEAMSKDGKRGEEDTADKGRLKGVTISCSDECENDGSRGEPSSLKDPDSCSRRRASTVSGTTSRRQRKIPEVSINVGSPTKKDFEPVTFTFDTNELKQNDKKVSATFTIKETQVTERGTSDKGSCKSPRNSFRFRNDLASSTKVQQSPNCVFKPQKLTFQLEKCQVKDGTGNFENGQNEAIPTICVNDEVCPVSPPSVTLNNNVEKLDRRQVKVPTLQLSSTKNVATVNFKPDGVQSITVKLDDINNALQFPANQVTCHVPRRSTGSSIGSSGLHRP